MAGGYGAGLVVDVKLEQTHGILTLHHRLVRDDGAPRSRLRPPPASRRCAGPAVQEILEFAGEPGGQPGRGEAAVEEVTGQVETQYAYRSHSWCRAYS
ncbi:hypothetical protein [Streptomyces sp. DASNCL29]|uniref:hypothetical protein n=1 Tax=Streptomyces sp. DASNCL29 TaxID=2583819 RepID=UPI00110FE5E5|nr:hypothetical protein [Streptomyces sp. DASNCL29]TMV00059.1 hypothetical protein FGK60_21960 [Streptomyces sp. DASNCL29]